MLAVYVVLYNGTTLWHTIGLIEIVMTCYGGKSKFADAFLAKVPIILYDLIPDQ